MTKDKQVKVEFVTAYIPGSLDIQSAIKSSITAKIGEGSTESDIQRRAEEAAQIRLENIATDLAKEHRAVRAIVANPQLKSQAQYDGKATYILTAEIYLPPSS